MKGKQFDTTHGITIIALVITIIVTIIIAVVSIAAMINKGLITNAKNAKDEYEQAAQAEQEFESELRNWKYGKYATVAKTEENSGTLLKIDDNEDSLVAQNYRIYGNSEQNGEPSPETPVEIESVGDIVLDDVNHNGQYKIPITVCGRNFFQNLITNTSYTNGSTVSINNDSSITIKKVAGDMISLKQIISLPAGKYTLTSGLENGNRNLYLQVDKGQNNTFITATTTSDAKTFTHTGGMLRVVLFSSETYESEDEITLYPQILSGEYNEENLPEYEPYQGITTNIYLNEPLRAVGGKADYIDFKSGKVVRNVTIRNLKATATSSIGSNGGNLARFYMSNIKRLVVNNKETVQVLSNGFKALTYSEYINNSSQAMQGSAGNVTNGAIFFKINKELIGGDTLDLCNTYLTNNPILVYYIADTPTEESIDSPDLPLYEGVSYIRVETSVAPSRIEVNY